MGREYAQQLRFFKSVGLVLCALIFSIPAFSQWQTHSFESMGTKMSVTIWHTDSAVRKAAIEAVQIQMHELDGLLSFYKPQSALMKMNTGAPHSPVKVPAELFRILQTAQQISKLSEGAFDVTVGTIGVLYDLPKGRAPGLQTASALSLVSNYKQLQLDSSQLRVFFENPNIQVDLGGIAKGYAVDRCIDKLLELGITQAQVTAGGDTRFLGIKGDRPWWIGIRHPRIASENALVLPIEARAISTSGDYERFFIQGEQHIHHILNPATGLPTKELASVSVLAEHSVWADGLATAVFVMGGPAGLELINQMPGVDAIIIDRAGQVFYSNGFEALNTSVDNMQLAMPSINNKR